MSKPSRRLNRQQRPRHNLPDYRRRQPARALAVLICIPLLVCLLAALSRPQYGLSLWLISSLFLLAFLLFSSLTVSVTQQNLHWHFGPGLISKQVAIRDIAHVEIVRTRLLDGLGIHFTRYGWLYNVSGRDAVAITLKDGKRFALGSGDVVGLWEAIEQRIAPPADQSSVGGS